MSIQPKARSGNDQVQVLVYVPRFVLEVFDEHVGKGNRSSVIRQLMAQYNVAKTQERKDQ